MNQKLAYDFLWDPFPARLQLPAIPICIIIPILSTVVVVRVIIVESARVGNV